MGSNLDVTERHGQGEGQGYVVPPAKATGIVASAAPDDWTGVAPPPAMPAASVLCVAQAFPQASRTGVVPPVTQGQARAVPLPPLPAPAAAADAAAAAGTGTQSNLPAEPKAMAEQPSPGPGSEEE